MAVYSGEWLVLRGPDEVIGWGGLEARGGSETRLRLVVLELEAVKGLWRWPGEKGGQVGAGESGVPRVCPSPSSQPQLHWGSVLSLMPPEFISYCCIKQNLRFSDFGQHTHYLTVSTGQESGHSWLSLMVAHGKSSGLSFQPQDQGVDQRVAEALQALTGAAKSSLKLGPLTQRKLLR